MSGAVHPCAVVKIGGSLVSDASRLRACLAQLAEGGDGPAVIVPGGGPFADAVRATQRALDFSDALAHRLALDAMGRMAAVFHGLEPRLRVSGSVEEASGSLCQGRSVIWDPADLRGGHPAVPESWEVTSDSLALWLATRLDAKRCVLVKSAPCPAGATPGELARLGLVDRAFPSFARVFEGEIAIRTPVEEVTITRDPKERSSHPPPHPEMRGEAEPRRSPRARADVSGGLLRRRFAGPQDEGGDGIDLGGRLLS